MSKQLVISVTFTCPICEGTSIGSLQLSNQLISDLIVGKSSEIFSREFEVNLRCERCGTIFPGKLAPSSASLELTLNEYPSCYVEAVVLGSAVDVDDHEWVDDKYPNDALAIFLDTYHLTGDILEDYGGHDGSHLINRMVFAQLVGSLEAFLGDTMLRGIREKPGALTSLLQMDRGLRNRSFTLEQIAKNPKIVEESVDQYLREILYHNLSRVDALFQNSFGIRILRDEAVNTALMKAVSYRHDCVHRNGRDKNDNQLTVFTKSYVQNTADILLKLVEIIDQEMWSIV